MTLVRRLVVGAVWVGIVASQHSDAAADPLDPPHRLSAVPLERVVIDDPFWSPKRRVWQAVTIRDCLAKFERDGAFRNLEKVSSHRGGVHEGEPWFDGLVCEVVTAASDFLRSHEDPGLERLLDGCVVAICAAAESDPEGMLSTYTQLERTEQRWGNNGGELRFQHDVYNAGCLIEAGVHYYRATGETRLLRAATRLASNMAASFGPPPKQNVIPGHALPETALVELDALYQEEPDLATRMGVAADSREFLRLAEFFVWGRGRHEGREPLGSYAQDDIPVLEQRTIEGHAVRATLLGAGLAAIAGQRPEGPYRDVAVRLWDNMTQRRMYVTGGVGSIAEDERFGPDYHLPNDGYMEVCASVGAGFFHHGLHLATADASYADELERVLYNGVLSGVSLSGDRYLYTDPLTSAGDVDRWSWHACPCCPPMFLKLMGAMPSFVYSESPDALYVNLYIGSRAEVHTGGRAVEVRQSTEGPLDEKARIVFNAEGPFRTRLHLRLPAWCDRPTLLLNGRELDNPVVRDGYAVIERSWSSGDEVVVRLPNPVRRVRAHPRVQAAAGRIALCRGPLVYCLEDEDNSDQISSLYLPEDAELRVEQRPDILGGVDLIRCSAVARSEAAAGGELYRDASGPDPDESFSAVAIPFFAHSNRGATRRLVWIPEGRMLASVRREPTVASQGKWSASHCGPIDTVAALNDRVDPAASDDESLPRFTWWPHRGSTEWVQCDFSGPTEVGEVEVYWWDESRTNRDCRPPQHWRVLTLEDGDWVPVADQTEGGTDPDRFNRISFPSRRLSAIRIEAHLQPGWSAGILEARVSP